MSFGFPAYSVGSQRYNLWHSDLLAVVGEALGRLGWRYEMPSPDDFIARSNVSLWSWGERIAVDVSFGGVVTARSECLLVAQCFDWGKNRRNVEAFFAEVSRGVSSREVIQLQAAPYSEGS